jgi:hypothetical protein
VELSKDAAFLFDVFTQLNITVETLKLLQARLLPRACRHFANNAWRAQDTIDDATELLASEAAAAGRKGVRCT